MNDIWNFGGFFHAFSLCLLLLQNNFSRGKFIAKLIVVKPNLPVELLNFSISVTQLRFKINIELEIQTTNTKHHNILKYYWLHELQLRLDWGNSRLIKCQLSLNKICYQLKCYLYFNCVVNKKLKYIQI